MPAEQRKKPRLIDERLVTALSHETRAHALTVFTERPASTKELAEELDQSVSAVWYHVDKLLKLGCIEQVATKKRRGANERFFRATIRHFFDSAAWESLSEQKRLVITMGILRSISGDLDEGLRGNTMDAVDSHISRTLLVVDAEGWAETNELLAETLEGLLLIRERSAERMAGSDELPKRASVAILGFELPRPSRA